MQVLLPDAARSRMSVTECVSIAGEGVEKEIAPDLSSLSPELEC